MVLIEEKCRLNWLDWLLAVVAGGGAFLAYWLFSCGLQDPSQWRETVVSAGLVPPREIFPGYWRGLTSWMFPMFGVGQTIKILAVSGAAVGGLCVALSYLIIRQLLAFLLRTSVEYPVWQKKIAPYFALFAAVLVATVNPLWRVFQTFSPDSFRLLLVLYAVYLWLRWMTHGKDWRLYPLVALTGLISAETPFGFLLPFIFIFGYYRLWNLVFDEYCETAPDLQDPENLPKWRMFFLYLAAVGLGAWINVKIFVSLGGVEANGLELSDLYFRYGVCLGKVIFSASTFSGWVLGLGFCVFPFFIVLHMFPTSVGDDTAMAFRRGVILFLVGAITVMQTGAFPDACFWVWKYTASAVLSPFLLAVFVILAIFAVAMVGALFAFECQRKYLHEEDEKPGVKLRYMVPVIALCLALLAIFSLRLDAEREMTRIVNDAIDETLQECEGAKWIFTDGHLDDGIRLMAAAKSNPLKPLNMMSSGGDYEKFIRERDFPEDSIDRENVGIAVPTLFRVWATEKPHGLDEAAIQLGFELWKRENKPLPRLSGLVGRETGLDEAQAKRGIDAAGELAKRIFELVPRADAASPSLALTDAYAAVLWRLSRLARLRDDSDLADQLDDSNTVLKKMLSLAEYERQRAFMMLTPMEGLQIALRRADFIDAMRYAPSVLRSDEDSPEGNFAMGMGCLKQGRMADAERYLRRCLVRRPDEPAVLNNLSILCRRADRFEEAVQLAERAHKMLPNSDEVKKTLQDAVEALAASKEKDKPRKPKTKKSKSSKPAK